MLQKLFHYSSVVVRLFVRSCSSHCFVNATVKDTHTQRERERERERERAYLLPQWQLAIRGVIPHASCASMILPNLSKAHTEARTALSSALASCDDCARLLVSTLSFPVADDDEDKDKDSDDGDVSAAAAAAAASAAAAVEGEAGARAQQMHSAASMMISATPDACPNRDSFTPRHAICSAVSPIALRPASTSRHSASPSSLVVYIAAAASAFASTPPGPAAAADAAAAASAAAAAALLCERVALFLALNLASARALSRRREAVVGELLNAVWVCGCVGVWGGMGV